MPVCNILYISHACYMYPCITLMTTTDSVCDNTFAHLRGSSNEDYCATSWQCNVCMPILQVCMCTCSVALICLATK